MAPRRPRGQGPNKKKVAAGKKTLSRTGNPFRFICGNCGQGYTRPKTVKDHRGKCVRKNGTNVPYWDSNPTCWLRGADRPREEMLNYALGLLTGPALGSNRLLNAVIMGVDTNDEEEEEEEERGEREEGGGEEEEEEEEDDQDEEMEEPADEVCGDGEEPTGRRDDDDDDEDGAGPNPDMGGAVAQAIAVF